MMAQYQIKIKSIRTTDSVAYFRGAVFDDKNFLAKDTIPLYKGSFTIKYAKSIVGGVYYLYFPKSKQKVYFIARPILKNCVVTLHRLNSFILLKFTICSA